MKSKLLIMALLIIFIIILPVSQVMAIGDDFYCKYAQYNPGYALACLWSIMFEMWDPLDWGDNDVAFSDGINYENLNYIYNRISAIPMNST